MKIIALGEGWTYKLFDPEKNKVMDKYIHANRLKPFYGTPPIVANDVQFASDANMIARGNVRDTVQADVEAANDSDSCSELPPDVYPVKKVLQAAKIRGKMHYKILWDNPSKKREVTWEPEENLSQELIDDFNRLRAQGQRQQQQRRRKY